MDLWCFRREPDLEEPFLSKNRSKDCGSSLHTFIYSQPRVNSFDQGSNQLFIWIGIIQTYISHQYGENDSEISIRISFVGRVHCKHAKKVHMLWVLPRLKKKKSLTLSHLANTREFVTRIKRQNSSKFVHYSDSLQTDQQWESSIGSVLL